MAAATTYVMFPMRNGVRPVHHAADRRNERRPTSGISREAGPAVGCGCHGLVGAQRAPLRPVVRGGARRRRGRERDRAARRRVRRRPGPPARGQARRGRHRVRRIGAAAGDRPGTQPRCRHPPRRPRTAAFRRQQFRHRHVVQRRAVRRRPRRRAGRAPPGRPSGCSGRGARLGPGRDVRDAIGPRRHRRAAATPATGRRRPLRPQRPRPPRRPGSRPPASDQIGWPTPP